jgi:NDP-sugar pyrophosphorylase family protein
MDAMILAAGLGTRLRPLTDRTPKALIQVGGVTMLERIARRLVAAGADRIIVNVHRHADAIERFTERLGRDLDVEILLSREEERPLETGGGVLLAAPLFRRDAPFFLHNVDIITDLDLSAMVEAHRASSAIATLAVHARDTSRYLLFDEEGLFGREDLRSGDSATVRVPIAMRLRLAFAGVHVIEPKMLDLLTERGAFSILDSYLRLAAEGYRILPFEVTGVMWLEIGDPERLERARRALASMGE